MVYNCVIIVSFQARLLPGLESQHRELLLDMAVPECELFHEHDRLLFAKGPK